MQQRELLLLLAFTQIHALTLLIPDTHSCLAGERRSTENTAGMWARSFIWKHLPGGLLPEHLQLCCRWVACWYVILFIVPDVAVATTVLYLCHSISAVSAQIFCRHDVTHGSPMNLLTAPLEDNEAHLIRYLELWFYCWMNSWASECTAVTLERDQRWLQCCEGQENTAHISRWKYYYYYYWRFRINEKILYQLLFCCRRKTINKTLQSDF